jgi:hypothetical protein
VDGTNSGGRGGGRHRGRCWNRARVHALRALRQDDRENRDELGDHAAREKPAPFFDLRIPRFTQPGPFPAVKVDV